MIGDDSGTGVAEEELGARLESCSVKTPSFINTMAILTLLTLSLEVDYMASSTHCSGPTVLARQSASS